MICHRMTRLRRLAVSVLLVVSSFTLLAVESQSTQSTDELFTHTEYGDIAHRKNAFEANAHWIKGEVLHGAELRKIDPRKRTEELWIKNDEDITLYVSYRCPAMDEKQWAKVSFRLSVQSPDESLSHPEEDKKEVLAGEGIISPERLGHWAASHGKITVRFTEEDPRGIYIFRVTVKDHVGNKEVICITKVHLR